jgi:hypothetical protein
LRAICFAAADAPSSVGRYFLLTDHNAGVAHVTFTIGVQRPSHQPPHAERADDVFRQF